MSTAVGTAPSVRREWEAPYRIDLPALLGPLRRGTGDPACRVTGDGAHWRTMRTPAGAATQRVEASGSVAVGQWWGPGAEWAAGRLPELLGVADDTSGFDASLHPLVDRLWRERGAAARFCAVGTVFDLLVPTLLEQRVTGAEARRAWRVLLRAHGEPAPGPAPEGMRVPPDPAGWRRVPSWEWHAAGVERTRSDTVMRAAAVARRIEECASLPGPQARERLARVPGIGVWTAAEVAQRALGDADAVSYGDFHIPANTVWALTGETDGDDARLAEVLAPWVGHRGRVVRLLELAGITRPRRGPRYRPLDFRSR